MVGGDLRPLDDIDDARDALRSIGESLDKAVFEGARTT